MTTNWFRNRNRPSIGHVMATIGVVCGALVTTLLVSAALKAVDQVDRADNALAELSHYVTDGHASVHARVSASGSFDDEALARFDKGVERRVAQFVKLKTIFEPQATAYAWAQPLLGNANIVRVDEERRAYVAAASAAATTPTRDRTTSLRVLDLRAQKLIQTVEALRDSADAARGRILIAIDGMVAMSLGIGVLLMVYLIWKPLLGGARHSPGASLVSRSIAPPAIPFTHQRTEWLPG